MLLTGATALAQNAGRYAWATAIFPSGHEFRLEIADTPASRARGYMFRAQVAPDEGMLFLFDQTSHRQFWMKNCKVALDIIWLSESFDVVEIAADQPPCPPDGACPDIFPMRSGHYVLEVAGGMAARQGLKVGDRVTILSEPSIP